MATDISTLTLQALRRILRATETDRRKLAAATGLTPSQWQMLREVEARGEPTPGSIAGALKFSQATITAISDRLVALGLITRSRGERDKRQVFLKITEQGRSVLNDTPDGLQEAFRAGFDALPLWEQAMILSAMERIGAILGAGGIDAAPILDSGAIDRSQP